MIDWNAILSTLLSSTVLIGILALVAQKILEQVLNKDISAYKNKLDLELERFKMELQQNTFENQTRFQNLHGKRAEVIAELYNLLVQAERDAISLVNPITLSGEPSLNEKSNIAYKSAKTFFEFFERNRIYFKKESCERIEKFNQELGKTLVDFRFLLGDPSEQYDIKRRTDKWKNVWEKLTEELPAIKKEIEDEFRGILGL